jgi:thiol-disulfide isomerase/thioredoxin
MLAVCLLTGVTLPTFAQDRRPPASAETVRRAQGVLEMAAAAYQRVPALEDVMIYHVTMPMAEPATGKLQVAVGAGKDAYLRTSLFTFTALDGRMYVTRADSPERYVDVPFDGDFRKTLTRLFVNHDFWPLEPIHVAMRGGKGIKAYIEALTFKPLGRLRLADYEMVDDETGRSMHQVTLVADNGHVLVHIDPMTYFLSDLKIEMTPSGTANEGKIIADVRYHPKVVENPQGLIAFDPGRRIAVEAISLLNPRRLAPGDVAPDFDRVTLDGERVSLRKLRDSVVVLDFWASWCVPCGLALPKLQQFASWAKSSGKPIRVFTVNTREEFPSLDERRTRVVEFWKAQEFTMPILLDSDNSLSDSFGSPALPFTVVIGPDGKVGEIHVGYSADMIEKLKEETAAMLTLPR